METRTLLSTWLLNGAIDRTVCNSRVLRRTIIPSRCAFAQKKKKKEQGHAGEMYLPDGKWKRRS